MRRKIYATANAWIQNISPIPGEPFFQAGGPAIKKHFALSDEIESAWKKTDREETLKA